MGHGEEIHRRSRALRDDAAALVDELRGAAKDFNQRVDLGGRLERHPYQTLAVAAVLGYVLGGGLLTHATGRLLGAAARVMVLPLVRAELAVLMGGLMGGEGEVKYHA